MKSDCPAGAGAEMKGDTMAGTGKRIPLVGVLMALLAQAVALAPAKTAQSEAERLVEVLALQPGMTVAEVGAGDGAMAVDVARRLGSGAFYATEIEQAKVDRIAEAGRSAGLERITAMRGEAAATGLPAECCDAIYMRRVYHHFTDAAAMNRSLFEALKPGGRLAVVDFPPNNTWRRPSGVSHSRGGHGMPADLLIKELEAAGFRFEQRIDDWTGREYCVIVTKPR